MLGQLGLTRGNIRPGPSGNPSATNAANRFEERVNQYTLSDPLVFKNGRQVKSASEWSRRRLEIIEDFEKEIYGRLPANVAPVRWEIVSVTGNSPIRLKLLKGIVDNTALMTCLWMRTS